MPKVEQEAAALTYIDPTTYRAKAQGMVSGVEYNCILYPFFYDPFSGATMVYMPTVGSVGYITDILGGKYFIPSMIGGRDKPTENLPMLQPGEIIIKGPSGAQIKIAIDKITISAGMGLASRQYIGNSDSIMDVCRRYLLNSSGVQITAGPTIPSPSPVSPTRLSIEVKETGGTSLQPPDLVVQMGTTTLSGVILLISHLASMTMMLLRKTGELEMRLLKMTIGNSATAKRLVTENFLNAFLNHTHQDAGKIQFDQQQYSDLLAGIFTNYITSKLCSE